jgi:hypothetical protein
MVQITNEEFATELHILCTRVVEDSKINKRDAVKALIHFAGKLNPDPYCETCGGSGYGSTCDVVGVCWCTMRDREQRTRTRSRN